MLHCMMRATGTRAQSFLTFFSFSFLFLSVFTNQIDLHCPALCVARFAGLPSTTPFLAQQDITSTKGDG
jgi:hypothetical protein